jgi:DNA/RNA endonuclease G (NUC1)/fibronectin type 3 domain-containing protein
MSLRRTALLFGLCLVLGYSHNAFPAISLSAPASQTFNAITNSATAALPTDFKVDKQTTARTVGTWATAVSATEKQGGASLSGTAANGIYNFGSGTLSTGDPAERAIGFLSSGPATKSGNLYASITNDTTTTLPVLRVAYSVEKYRTGTNPNGFQVALYYSTDGSTWTPVAGAVTSFPADTTTAGYSPAPGSSTPVSQDFTVNLAPGGALYLAWNYSVSSGLITTFAQALAIDDITVSTPPPAVASISRANPSPTNATAVDYTVTFDQSVTGVDASDFTLKTLLASTATGTIGTVTGSGSTYTVPITGITGEGSFRLDLNASPTISNGFGVAATTGFTTGETYVIDVTAPTVTTVAVPAGDTYGLGKTLAFVVSFSEAVVVDTSGVPQLSIGIGSGSVPASYVSGSGTTDLTFSYTIPSGASDSDGITVGGTIAANGGTIKDLAGNSANLNLNSVGSTAGVFVDGIPPSIASVTLPANGTHRAGQNLDFTITFSENVIVDTTGGTPALPITLDTGSTVNATYLSGSGTPALVFRYTIASGNADPNGIEVGIFTSGGGTIRDVGKNDAVLTLPSLSTLLILVDGIAPTVSSINRVGSTPTNATTADFTVAFSENVSGVDTSDFTLTATGTASGTIASIATVNASTYTITVNAISGDGTIRLDLNSSGTGITDTPGNAIGGGFTTGQAYTFDHTAPAVTSVSVPTNSTYAAGQNLDFTVNFGEAVTVTGAPRIGITLNTGTVYASYLSGSGTSALAFRYTVAAGNADPDGIVVAGTIDANGGTLRDAATNDALLTLNSVDSTTSVLVDATAPTVVSVTRAGSTPTNAASVIFTVTFSTSVTGVDGTDFAVVSSGVAGTPAVSGFSGSGTTYTVTVTTGTGDGTIGLDVINDGSIKNASNTPLSSGFTGEIYTIDRTAPAVSTVVRADGSPTKATAVHFTVTFSESVTGVDAGDLSLTTSGVAGTSITDVTGSGTTYAVTVNSGSGDGTIRLDVAANGTIIDAAGNALAGVFTSGTPYTIDKTAPTVSSVTAADATPTNAATIHYTVTFSESVTGVDAADFSLTNSGVAGTSITNVAGIGTTYTVTVNSGTGDGTIRLDLNSTGTGITDAVGNAISGGFTTGTPFTIDHTAPTVTITHTGTDPSSAATVDFTVTFSESVSGVATSVFSINAAAGIAGTSITTVTGSGTTYTVTVSTGTGNGALGLDLTNGAAVKDAAGNAVANTTGGTYTMQGSPSAPVVTATSGDSHVALSWTAASDATSYAVKRALASAGPYTTIDPSHGVATYDDTTAVNGTTYYYVVSATGARGTSADSSPVSATPSAPGAGGGIVISQVYGGGGNAGSVYKNDFVELFNAGSSTVSVAGWSVQYTSAAGTTWQVTNLSGSIAAGHYYLVQESAGTGGTTALPTPEATGAILMSATAGKIALVNSTTALAGACPTGSSIIDFVGFGPTATCFEGSAPTAVLTNTTAAFRAANGCTDTNNNSADFSAAVAAPRNGASPANPCGGTVNTPPAITAPANPITSVLPDAAPFTVSLTGTDDGSVFNWSATPGTGVSAVSVTGGQGTANATFTVTLAAAFIGTATFTASLSDTVNTAVTQVVNISVSAAPPAIPTGLSATAGNAHVALTWSAALGATGYNVKRSTVSGSGYTTIATRATTSYDDTAVANGTTYYYVVSATSTAGESANSSEVAAAPNYVDVVISQVYGGGGSGSPAYANDFVELFNRGASTADLSGYSIQYGSATGVFGNSGVGFSGVYVFPAGTMIPSGRYLTVKTGPAALAGATFAFDLQTPTTDLNMSATTGKVALASLAVSLGCGATATPCALPDARILDVVAYGTANNGEGGTVVSGADAATGALRNGNGCTDTNNNSADFTAATIATGLVPRTLASAANVCGVTINHSPSINPPSNPIMTVTQPVGTFTLSLAGFDDGGVYSWSATAGTGIASVSVSAGQSTANATFSVTLQPGFYGTASFTASLSDGANPPVTALVNIKVNPDLSVDSPPLITAPANPIASVAQDSTPFTVSLSGNDDRNVYTWSATAGTGISSVIVSAGAGTANVTFTVTLVAAFNGAATFTASLSDGVNAPVTQAVNITVRSASHLVISQLYGGGGNSGAVYRNDYVELFNPTTTTFDLTGWTLQYASATASSFTNIAPLGGSIGPGQYVFIALASGGAEGADLPPANIYGDLNMSATTGKVALVSNGDGATSCTDPDVVDLVGYGTASCSEGANAPAMSNTTGLFRKNGGRVDTDNNLNDFTIGAPVATAPTAPIVEIGPSIVSTDPVKGGTNAPRDANITVNFSEPVDVAIGWFTINCASTGVHNDATVARAGSRSWVIIPNVNFVAAELCTATVFKDFVHDSDLNDSAPNTDTLLADYSWTFTVSTGAAPPYPSSVHLTMGNPSGAVADINVPNNYLMQKPEYAESYNRDRGTANWVSWHLASEWYGSLTRVDTFRADPAVPPAWYRVLGTDYSGSGFDRGHMTPNADRDGVVPINQATYLMSNMIPQSPDNNQGPWASFEGYLRILTDAGAELYIVSGPFGTGGTGSNGFTTTIAGGHVTVPASTWKVVLVLPKASGDDVARVTASTRTMAILIPNVQGIMSSPWTTYLTTVDAIETLTGYDFFPNVPPAIQASIENGRDGVNPPGAGMLSVSTPEEVAKTIALQGASPTGGAITYTILTQPLHGALSGTLPNQTYTPAVDYYGTDSFTYRVNDGTADSAAATVTIAVTEVNDTPTAVDDLKSTSQNTPLIFPAADLTVNDLAGPANESGQVMTVTAVTATAQTHGSVTLSGGQVTYAPDAAYLGPASFTYRACDNGLTGGASDPLCATATVNVNVATCSALVTAAPVTLPPTICPASPDNTASAPAGAVSYSWQVTNGAITAGQGTSSISYTAGASGTVSFSVLMTMPSGCPARSSGSTLIAGPTASMVPEIHACPGAPVSVSVMLDGVGPFDIVWSDGVRQWGITATTVTRDFTATENTIVDVSVHDASCATATSAMTEIIMDGPPRFGPLPVNLKIWPGEPLMITVNASPATALEWFEGQVGDESKHVGSGSTFTTPPLHGSITYWVRADSRCGSTRSGPIAVTVLGARRRPSSH